MIIGKEIPFRRSKHDHDTGSLVFDQERAAQRDETAEDASIPLARDGGDDDSSPSGAQHLQQEPETNSD